MSLHHDMRYQFYDSSFERFRADVQYIGGTIEIILSPSSSMRERAEALLVGTIMTIKVFSPTTRFIKLGNKLRQFRKVSPGISVMA